jgi:spore maturation protein A
VILNGVPVRDAIVHTDFGDVLPSSSDLAGAAVELCLGMLGGMCLWMGVMELMQRSGLAAGLARLFRPLLQRLLPRAARDVETLGALSANVSANLLGLGNAATPLGIRAAQRMARGCGGVADDELCRLVVLNTASIQLIPTTVAAIRASLGCQHPFDILPAVWITSFLSAGLGLAGAVLLGKVYSHD